VLGMKDSDEKKVLILRSGLAGIYIQDTPR
jgi:hypothetical protein